MKPTITYHRRLEIRFPDVPPRPIRTVLKERGFWWDGRAHCWYLARPVSLRLVRNEPVVQNGFEYALQACCEYLELTAAEAEQIRKQHEFAGQQAAEQGMEEACGIA